MTNHKQAKAQKRAKHKQKEINMHRHSFRSMSPDSSLEHPKPLSEEEILAQRRPIAEKAGEPPSGAPIPSKPKEPPSDKEAVKEPIPVGAGVK